MTTATQPSSAIRHEYERLGLEGRLSPTVGFSDAMRQMQIDVKGLGMCVSQTLQEFESAGGSVADLDEDACFCYCAQAMFASATLSMGNWEKLVVNETQDLAFPENSARLDALVEQEMFRIGMFDVLDSRAVREYKHMVFGNSWMFCMSVDLLRCGPQLQASVSRICGSYEWVERGFARDSRGAQ